MIGMRDRLIHHYFGIDWDLVADVIREGIKRLRKRRPPYVLTDVEPAVGHLGPCRSSSHNRAR